MTATNQHATNQHATNQHATNQHRTPFGTLTLAASETGLTRCRFSTTGAAGGKPGGPGSTGARLLLDRACQELDEYFAGRLREFTVPVDLGRVEPGRRRVLGGLAEVGYGETISYTALACSLGLDGFDAPRRVGAAMAANPVLIVVPCHRVVGAGGKLVGYAGGLPAKRGLLDLESHLPALF